MIQTLLHASDRIQFNHLCTLLQKHVVTLGFLIALFIHCHVVKRYACEEYYNAVMPTMEVINALPQGMALEYGKYQFYIEN